jgi:hypothetical protein
MQCAYHREVIKAAATAPHPLVPHGFANWHTSARPQILSTISVIIAMASILPLL